MQFNPYLNKQAREIIFSRKTLKPAHSSIHFNDTLAAKGNIQKHLGLFLDEKLNFNYYKNEKLAKVMEGINVIKKLSNVLPRHSLDKTYK